jgi:hypothetical protein
MATKTAAIIFIMFIIIRNYEERMQLQDESLAAMQLWLCSLNKRQETILIYVYATDESQFLKELYVQGNYQNILVQSQLAYISPQKCISTSWTFNRPRGHQSILCQTS